MHPTTSFIAVVSILIATSVSALAGASTITAELARERAIAGELIMIDIRSFDEIAETGIPDVALLADRYVQNFTAILTAIQAQAPEIPIALMCRRGDCASQIPEQLRQAGIDNVLDILGGYYGSFDIAGWSSANMPIRNIDMSVSGLIPYKQP